MSEKLLIVEDDKKLNDGIRLALKNDAYFFYQCRTLHACFCFYQNRSCSCLQLLNQ